MTAAPTPADSTARARSLARALGFAAAGAAPLGPTPHADAARAFFGAGHHGQMDWLARSLEDRLDPRRRFPWAKSALALATPHEAPTRAPDRDGAADISGRVAAYARGRDYHKVLERRTRELGRRLGEAIPGLEWRAYVDTGPLLERDLARAAGLGWIGKNGMLLSADLGSYLMLSVLLVSVELEPAAPVLDQCGGCRKCLDACPTGALVAERVLDATRCLSYVTIEQRGELDPPDLAGYAFGCDLCQLACPYNAHAAAGDPELAPRPELAELALADWVALDHDTYQASFRASAIKRAGRAGLVRNAMWLAHQLGDEPALAATARRRHDPDPIIAGTARAVTARARP